MGLGDLLSIGASILPNKAKGATLVSSQPSKAHQAFVAALQFAEQEAKEEALKLLAQQFKDQVTAATLSAFSKAAVPPSPPAATDPAKS
jgi:hypothetical protein